MPAIPKLKPQEVVKTFKRHCFCNYFILWHNLYYDLDKMTIGGKNENI